MSDYVPFDIQEKIMKRLPVKSLIQFRSVSKAWKSLIDSSEFIISHSLHCHTQPQHLLVSYEDLDRIIFCRSYIDDDSFPQQMSMLTLTPSVYALQVLLPQVVGSSRGLLCLRGFARDEETDRALLWNPSIRKSITVALPYFASGLGFGVCPVTNDPKIVSIPQSSLNGPDFGGQVMVYTLSSGKWRSLSNNLPTKRIRDVFNAAVVTDGFIYWDAELETNMIMSFDLTSESFETIDLPPASLAHHSHRSMCISKLKDSVALLQYGKNNDICFCTVWMMEHGAQRLFTKLFTVETPYGIAGFRKNGVPIMNMMDDDGDDDDDDDDIVATPVVYEPNSEHNNVLETCSYIFLVNSYMETLLLLDRSDCISF